MTYEKAAACGNAAFQSSRHAVSVNHNGNDTYPEQQDHLTVTTSMVG